MQNNDQYAAQASKHFVALKDFLVEHLKKEQAGISPQRQSAREKLTRLTHSQFHELSTDVYDEMNRRLLPNNQDNKSVPYLPLNESYHQKRNQARQKLATLSENRFKDLASDVYCELERRYSELSKPLPAPVTKSVSVSKSMDKSFDKPMDKQADDKPQEDSGLVNFMSLDNLMADLGNMITSTSQSPNKTTPSPVKQTTPQRGDVKPFQPQHSLEVSPSSDMDITNKTSEIGSAFKASEVGSYAKTPEQSSGKTDAQLRQIETERDRLASQKQALQSELDALKDKSRSTEEALKQLKDKQSKFDIEVATYKDTISEMDAAQVKLEDKVRDNEDIISALKQQVKSLKDELEARDAEIARHKESVSSYSSKIDKHGSEVKELRSVIDQKDITILTMTGDLDMLKSQLSDLTKGRKESITSNSSLPQKDVLTDIVDTLDLNNPNMHSKDGHLSAGDLMAIKSSVRELLKCCRKQNASDILSAMKATVSITRQISDTAQPTDNRSAMNDQLTAFVANCKTYAIDLTKSPNLAVPKSIDDSAKLFMQSVNTLAVAQKIKFLVPERSNSVVSDAISSKTPSPVKDVKDKTMSVDELKIYLEKQTDVIVQNIQLLLQSMRSSTFDDEFQGTVRNITTVVDALVKQSGATLNERCQPDVQKKGNVTINALKESNVRLGALGSSTTSAKPAKQKLAAAAYELAKFTKELVSIFE